MSDSYRRRNSTVRALQVAEGGITMDTPVPKWVRDAIDDGWAAFNGRGETLRIAMIRDELAFWIELAPTQWVVRDELGGALIRYSNREFVQRYEKVTD